MYNTEILQAGSRIIKQETPTIRVSKTTDVFEGLTAIERQTLYWAERKGLKLLNQKNKQ